MLKGYPVVWLVPAQWRPMYGEHICRQFPNQFSYIQKPCYAVNRQQAILQSDQSLWWSHFRDKPMEHLQQGLRAPDTQWVGTILNLYQSSAPVKGTPDTGRMGLNIVKPAMSMAEWTIVLMPFTWSSMNPKMVKSVWILIKIVSGYNCGLDTEQFLA